MTHLPIPLAIRTSNGKKILAGFPSAVLPLDNQRSAVFALQGAGGVDDRWVLGPYRSPLMIEAIHYVSQQDANIARTFSLHLSTDIQTTTLYDSDINLLDPLSPSALIMPGRTGVNLRMGRVVPTTHPFIKLSRQKGGSVTFAITVWLYLRST